MTGEDYTDKLGRLPDGVRKKEHLAGHNLYISNKTGKKDFHFLSVIAPVEQGGRFPEIKRIDDWTVAVDGDVISFDPDTKHNANLVIDIRDLRGKQPGLSPGK